MTDTALSQPLPGASFGQAVTRFFSKYATFSGRASRSEFWWVWLLLVIVNLAFVGILIAVIVSTGTATETGVQPSGAEIPVYVIWALFELAIIVPAIALTVRRLHDANFSGWLYLLHLVPYVGGLVVLILNIQSSKPEGARFDR